MSETSPPPAEEDVAAVKTALGLTDERVADITKVTKLASGVGWKVYFNDGLILLAQK